MRLRKRLTLDMRLDDVEESSDDPPAAVHLTDCRPLAWESMSSYREVSREALDMVGWIVQVSVRDTATGATAVSTESQVCDARPTSSGWDLSLGNGTWLYLDKGTYVRGSAQNGAFTATFGSIEVEMRIVEDGPYPLSAVQTGTPELT